MLQLLLNEWFGAPRGLDSWDSRPSAVKNPHHHPASGGYLPHQCMLQFAGQFAGPCELRLLRVARVFCRVLPCEGSEDTLPEVYGNWKGRSLLETSIFRFYVKLWRIFWILWTSVGEEIQEWKIKWCRLQPPFQCRATFIVLYWYSCMLTHVALVSWISFIVHLYAPSMHMCHLSSSFNKF